MTKDATTGKFVQGDKMSVTIPTLSTSEYVKVDIPAVEGQYIGIRASEVYLDDFAAEQVDKELARSLKITSVTKASNTGYSVDCDPTGHFTIELKATVTNNGDVTLNPGDENYSLSVVAVKTTAFSERKISTRHLLLASQQSSPLPVLPIMPHTAAISDIP